MAPDYLDEFDRQGQRNAGSCRSSPPASAFSSSGAASASTPPTGRWPPPRSTSSPRSSPFEQSSSGALAPPRDSSRRPPGRSARHLQQDLDDVAEGKQIGDGFDERQVPLGDDALPSPSEPRSFVSVKVRHGNLRNIRWQTISQAAGLDSTRPCNHILGLDVGGNLATSLTGAECYPWLLSLNLSQNDVRTLSAPRLPFMLTHLDLSHNVLKSLEVMPPRNRPRVVRFVSRPSDMGCGY